VVKNQGAISRAAVLSFKADFPPQATVLCLGAHCDDIEIGCGGALIELRLRYPQLRFHWVVFSGEDERERETRAAAEKLLGGADYLVEVLGFRASYFPYQGERIKDAFEALRTRVTPDLILTHFLGDRHQDHKVIAELTWNTFRSHAVLEYEIAKYEGDLEHPGVYFPLSLPAAELKVDTLMECFPSQRRRQWFDAELFRAQLRLRGVECNSPSRYAEAFHVRKLIL
jgi:LmbE family N-acetylglucosaminyl deacetylase